MIEESVAYLARAGPARDLRRRALLRRLPRPTRRTRSRRCEAAARGGAETRGAVRHQRRHAALGGRRDASARSSRRGRPPARHPHPQRRRAARVANSLAAVRAGAIQVQGTINGYGERCGNANLCSIIPDLELKLGLRCLPDGQLADARPSVSHFVAEVANLAPDEHLPYVGQAPSPTRAASTSRPCAATPRSYQHIDPALVGNRMRVVVSELSGRGNLLQQGRGARRRRRRGSDVGDVLERDQGAARRRASRSRPPRPRSRMMLQAPGARLRAALRADRLHRSIVEHRQGRGIFAEATVKVRVDGEVHAHRRRGQRPGQRARRRAAQGARAAATRSSAQFHLADYKVRILDGDSGTGAITRVLIDTQNGDQRWSTVGASTNIIEASWRALGRLGRVRAHRRGLTAHRPSEETT